MKQLKIALIAHDSEKQDLINWVTKHKEELKKHKLCSTGTTGLVLQKALDLEVYCYLSGPLGGDQQIGADIANGKIDMMIFFWDPMNIQPHDSDVKALIRICTLYNIPTAFNITTADMLFSSTMLDKPRDQSKALLLKTRQSEREKKFLEDIESYTRNDNSCR